MSYDYQSERSRLFTTEGIRMLLMVEETVRGLCEKSGYVSLGKAVDGSGDSWMRLACVHFLEELGYVEVIDLKGATQDNVVKWTRRARVG